MRYGFTTGSCAAAAAAAACYMLLTGRKKEEMTILTPKGISYTAKLVDISINESSAACAIVKDGGDDPDITTGAHIVAEVAFLQKESLQKDKTDAVQQIIIRGGKGVGRVTKPGLDQPVGEAAINHVPREMIEKEVRRICALCDYNGKLQVTISVPEGEEIAQKTFNPRLGITGGISILGTSGIVEPMSSQALLDTIQVELRQQKAMGQQMIAVTPGNYGLDFMKEAFAYDLDKSVKCSNFIGNTIDMAAETGFCGMLLTGHIGKLVKVSGGIMNTHSKEGDCRMELLAAAALKSGGSKTQALEILEAVTTEEGIRLLQEGGNLQKTMQILMEKIMFYLQKRAAGRLQIECMMYANGYGLLAESSGAEAMLEALMKNEN
ncbi:MAG: cobalt-precorrin-5B (C(1))-methyltransferase CbiD [Firmicutes bacterium]|nr:cobalt-precorrin-5B (C(1))-methyltransferase CbiD [Bacillota bacterium]